MSFDHKNSDMNNDIIDLNRIQDDKELSSDDMNIKQHLNESLDIKGITISEDLINRTLSAIKQSEIEQPGDQQQDNKSKDEMAFKKIIPWSRCIRKIAGVAAAVLIVTVGLSLTIRDSAKDDISQENSEMTAEDTSRYGTADASGTTAFEAEQSSEDGLAQSLDKDDTDTSIAPKSAINPEEGNDIATASLEDSKDEEDITEALTVDDGNGSPRTFEEIILTNSELVESLKIIDQTNNTEVVLTEQSDILNFYAVMEQQLFTIGTTAPISENYIVEAVGLQTEEVLYTMIIGDSISVSNSSGDSVDQSIYNTENNELLIQNIDELYQGINQE